MLFSLCKLISLTTSICVFSFFFQDMTSSHSFGSIIFKLKTAFKSQGFQSTFRVKVSVGHAAQTEEPVYVSLGVITWPRWGPPPLRPPDQYFPELTDQSLVCHTHLRAWTLPVLHNDTSTGCVAAGQGCPSDQPLLRRHFENTAHLQPGPSHLLRAGTVRTLRLALLPCRHDEEENHQDGQ